jgi:hypothetical protein
MSKNSNSLENLENVILLGYASSINNPWSDFLLCKMVDIIFKRARFFIILPVRCLAQ